MCGEVHAPFWAVRCGPRALRTVARGCAPRAGFPTTRRGAAWGTLGGWARPRTSAIVKQRTHLTTPTSQVMGTACAVSFTDVEGSNPAACTRVSGPGWNLQVGNFESIEDWFLVAVELGGVLNWIPQLPRTSHAGLVA